MFFHLSLDKPNLIVAHGTLMNKSGGKGLYFTGQVRMAVKKRVRYPSVAVRGLALIYVAIDPASSLEFETIQGSSCLRIVLKVRQRGVPRRTPAVWHLRF